MALFFTIVIIVIVILMARALRSKPEQTDPAEQQSNEKLLENTVRLMLLMEVKRQAELYGDSATVKAVNDMTYNGPLPELRPDGTYSRVYELQDYNIAGINYRDGIAAYVGEFTGYLQPDPYNEHDPNAIAVYHSDGHHLGFIPSGCTDNIRALGKPFPMPVTGTIEQEHDEDDNRDYFVGTVYFYVLSK